MFTKKKEVVMSLPAPAPQHRPAQPRCRHSGCLPSAHGTPHPQGAILSSGLGGVQRTGRLSPNPNPKVLPRNSPDSQAQTPEEVFVAALLHQHVLGTRHRLVLHLCTPHPTVSNQASPPSPPGRPPFFLQIAAITTDSLLNHYCMAALLPPNQSRCGGHRQILPQLAHLQASAPA